MLQLSKMDTYHTPVLLQEVMDGLCIQSGKRYVDATLGGGGHTKEIIRRGGVVLGIDADIDAIRFAAAEIKKLSKEVPGENQWICVQGNFRELHEIAKEQGFDSVSGVLMDLGVSSFQLDTANKGFSYRFLDSDLDMRMDQKEGESAAEYLNSVSEEELYEIFTKFGEEERAGAIAHALVRARQIKKFKTVGDLVVGIERAIGNSPEKNSIFSRIFQSVRIKINDELEALKEGMSQAYELLEPGGRLAIISFHSLEDRIVKLEMRKPVWKSVTKKPIVATDDEIWKNRRSRSAKLRIVEKI